MLNHGCFVFAFTQFFQQLKIRSWSRSTK